MVSATLFHWSIGIDSFARRKWSVVLALAVAFGCLASNASGEPVTFRFEAEIHTIREFANPSFALPFGVIAGDIIHGEVTLAEQGTRNALQLLSLKLRVGDVTLNTSDYDFAVLDNISNQLDPFTYDGLYTGPIDIIPPEVLHSANTGIAPLTDQVYLVCNPEGSFCPPDTVGGSSNILWQPVLNLIGDEGTIGDAAPPLSVAQWNEFSGRSLLIGLVTYGQPVGSYIITASVGPFRAVPEPSTIIILGFFSGAASLTRLCRRETKVSGTFLMSCV